jgi:Putative adhesin
MAPQVRTRRLSPWARVVTVSAVLVVGGLVALSVWAVASREKRVVSYDVRGAVSGVALDLGDGDLTIVGGGRRPGVAVQRTERFTFGHDADTQRGVVGGRFRVRSRCPDTVLQSCSVRYTLTVPDNVPLTVVTSSGDVRFEGYRGSAQVTTNSGRIDVSGFCGFSFQARTDSGDIDAATACPPPQLSLRSTTGDVTAAVPMGRYQVDAASNSGSHQIQGVTNASDAPLSIQALTTSGDVLVEGRR